MGQIIQYYIPARFVQGQPKWMPAEARGKLITFQTRTIARTCEQITASLTSRWMSFTPR